MDLRMVRRVCLPLAAALLLACLSGCGANGPGPRPSTKGSGSPTESPATKAGGSVNSMRWDQTFHDKREADRVFTLAKYEAIKPGMTYEEVIAVLAIPPGPLRPDDDMRWVGPESPVELSWFDGPKKERSITIKLRGKTVVEKAQSGLQ